MENYLLFRENYPIITNIFAIHLESETDRQVLLKRLPSSHPQYIRCRRAASENLKPGFFDGAPSFNGINVEISVL